MLKKKAKGASMDLDKLLSGIADKLSAVKRQRAEVKITEPYTEEVLPKKIIYEKSALPERLSKAKAIAENGDTMWLSREAMFLRQGRLLADYEDHFEETPSFRRYYPTYRDMNDSQLRCYFTWRTKLRRGEYERISPSYIFVYIYELLSLIGCDGPEDGLSKLRQLHKFVEEDSEDKELLLYYLDKWMVDFVVYYGLPVETLHEICDISGARALESLLYYEGKSKDEIFSALSCLSSYNISRSKFYGEYREDFERVSVGVYRDMSEYFKKHRKSSYFERLFGKEQVSPYRVFEGAVFRPEDKRGYEYSINALFSYKVGATGTWYVRRYPPEAMKSKALGKLMKSVDRLMREECSYASPLANEEITKQLSGVIAENIRRLKEEKKQRERAEIKIDISVLSRIRESAELTRERLIIDEETEEEETEIAISAVAENKSGVLTGEEEGFLKALLGREKVHSGAVPLSILCDSINEKLFESFCDNVIDFQGEDPYVIEDYEEELEEMLK